MQKGRDGHVFNVKWTGHHFVFIDCEGNERLNFMPFPVEQHLTLFEDKELISRTKSWFPHMQSMCMRNQLFLFKIQLNSFPIQFNTFFWFLFFWNLFYWFLFFLMIWSLFEETVFFFFYLKFILMKLFFFFLFETLI